MRERNFKVTLGGAEVERHGKFVDLHNFYDLLDVFFSLTGGSLSVVFSRNDIKPVVAVELPPQIVFRVSVYSTLRSATTC